MAEGLFRHIAGPNYRALSAGISAMDNFSASPETIQVMAGRGVDVSGHRSRRLTPALIEQADRIYAMERLHKEWVVRMSPQSASKVRLLSEFSSSDEHRVEVDIPDPIRMSESFYRNVLGVIEDCVTNLHATLERQEAG